MNSQVLRWKKQLVDAKISQRHCHNACDNTGDGSNDSSEHKLLVKPSKVKEVGELSSFLKPSAT
jgi:hypothetical protein